jgi:flavin reductase (DIM6/NTAB) family NADH-FMN oxidoreductase RutF
VGPQSLYKCRSKDTVMNCIDTNEFIWNMAPLELKDKVNLTALESWGDEFEEGNIAKADCKLVRPPRVANSPSAS